MAFAAPTLQHFIYINHREAGGVNIKTDKGLLDPRFSGAQIVYKWRDLEPTKGHYDFSAIKADIVNLNSINKKLWIQLQEKCFSLSPNVPAYLLQDPMRQYVCVGLGI
ncbi:hypothetical protein [Iodobacter fluviatilis]|uniref:hypothetical protein n=1 Tax=Iodobacter fluviatilis TaxID=537 RepID=UPI001A9F5678|nr:hypothetical protein [Iodobacter fluviatilis]